MAIDLSEGWEAIAPTFLSSRSDVGREVICQWAEYLQPGDSVLDVGCGSGAIVSQALLDRSLELYAIDASPTLVAAFQRNFPEATVACEAAQVSAFFNRDFDGAVAIGLLFLLSATDQRKVLYRISQAVKPGGHFLFSAPSQVCRWNDILTGRPSVSLGFDAYTAILKNAGMEFLRSYVDDGENHYFSLQKAAA